MALDKRKQFTRKQKAAILGAGGAAALAALGLGGIATNNNAHADTTAPQGTVQHGTPGVQSVQEQQASAPTTGQQTQQTGQQGGQTTTQQATQTTRQSAPTEAQASTQTQAAASRTTQPAATGQTTNHAGTTSTQTGAANTGARQSAPVQQGTANGNGEQYRAPQANTGASVNGSQNTGRTASVTGNQNAVQNGTQNANRAAGFNAGKLNTHQADLNRIQQERQTHLNDLAKIGRNVNQNTKQNPVVPDATKQKSGASKQASSASSQASDAAHLRKMDSFHPTFVIGPSKQQQADESKALHTGRADSINNVFDEAENAAKENVNRKDYQPVVDNAVKAIETATNQSGVANAQKTAINTLNTLEREGTLKNVFSGANDRPVPALPNSNSASSAASGNGVHLNVKAPAMNVSTVEDLSQFDLSSDGKTLTINGGVIPNNNIWSGAAQGINANHNYDSVTTLNLDNAKVVGDGQNLFAGMPSLKTVTGSLDASQADDLEGAFANDQSLSDIGGVANWKLPTTNVDLFGMFENDPQLEDLRPLAHVNVSGVDSVGHMFKNDPQVKDWTPIANNWTFNSDPEVNDMFAGDPANHGLDPTYNHMNGKTTLGSGSIYDPSNYIVGDKGANQQSGDSSIAGWTPASATNTSSSATSASSANSSAGSDGNDTGLVHIDSLKQNSNVASASASISAVMAGKSAATNGTSSKAKSAANPLAANEAQAEVLYHDPKGQVIGTRTVTQPVGSILDVGPKSQFEKMNMPRGYVYSDPHAPTQYVMSKNMAPIEVGVKAASTRKNAVKTNTPKSTNPGHVAHAGYGYVPAGNGIGWQHGAVTGAQLESPVNVEPAGGFGESSDNGAAASTPDVTTEAGGGASGVNPAPAAGGSTSIVSPSGSDDSGSGSDSGSSLPQTSEPVSDLAFAAAMGTILATMAGYSVMKRKHAKQDLENAAQTM